MFNKDTQYINIIKNQQNIKIDYKVLQNNTISKSEQSIFLLDNNQISNDTKLKLATLENNINKTYICTLCEDENQKIISNDEIVPKNFKAVSFDRKHNIILEKSKVKDSLNYYNDGQIDYLLSPFTILHDILGTNLHEKSLNLLILNNKIYAIILDEDKRICHSHISTLTSYEETSKNSFFDDEISVQKLYEEMYLLELQTFIENISKDFYDTESYDFFIENVNIFYNIKQLNGTQVNTLKDNLLLEVRYSQIFLDDILYNNVKKQEISSINFIKVRKKKEKNSIFYVLFILIILTSLMAGGIFYYKKFIQENMTIPKIKKVVVEKNDQEIIKEITLPMHKKLNIQKTNLLLKIFDAIGKEEVLKEIQVEENESTLICNLKSENSYENELKQKLLNIYEKSENVLTNQNQTTLLYTSIISNNNLLKKDHSRKIKLYRPNKKFKVLTVKNSEKYLSEILKNTTIKYVNTIEKKYTKYIFDIKSNINSPREFFDYINTINEQYYSITLSYPIEFTKSKNAIMAKYTLVFNQINKKMQQGKN